MDICIFKILIIDILLYRILFKKLTNVEKNTNVDNNLFNFDKSIKCLANIDNNLNIIIDNYKPKTQTKYDGKERVMFIFILIMKLF